MKLFEYLASGVAVVASDVGQIAQVLEHEINSLLVRPGDVVGMAAAVKRLIADVDLRTRIGQQARKDAVNRYSWDKYVLRLERLYRMVIEGRAVNTI